MKGNMEEERGKGRREQKKGGGDRKERDRKRYGCHSQVKKPLQRGGGTSGHVTELSAQGEHVFLFYTLGMNHPRIQIFQQTVLLC